MGTKTNEMNDVLECWEKRTELQRWIFFAIFWLLVQMNKRQKVFWLVIGAAIAGPLLFAFLRDPIAAGITLAIGVAVGLLFVLFWS